MRVARRLKDDLSVTVLPKPSNGGVCTTYTSTNVPTTIPTGPGIVTSTLTIPETRSLTPSPWASI